ncbi:MAG: hypothetical protein ACXW1D_00765 [Halobacteriota archaeon]
MAWQTRVLEWVIAFALLFGAYLWVGHHAVSEYKQEQVIAQMEKDKAQQKKYNVLAQDYEELKTKRQDNARTIVREVEKIIDRPVYRNVCIDGGGLSIINQAISGSSGELDAAVQSPN